MNQKSFGFSLIEILVVITIIGLLIAASGGAYQLWVKKAERTKTKAMITELEEYASDYYDRRGDYPPSMLKDLGIATTSDESNEGIEAFVQALYQKRYDGHRPYSTSDLINTDDDEANKNISVFERSALFEMKDHWDNPIIYMRSTDYKKPYTYIINDETVDVYALKNPKTNTYFKFESCQIISAGPDGIFDTDDDIANFDRPESDE